MVGVPDESMARRSAPGFACATGETADEEEIRDLLPRPDRSLQGSALRAIRRRLSDDGDRQGPEVPHSQDNDRRVAIERAADCLAIGVRPAMPHRSMGNRLIVG